MEVKMIDINGIKRTRSNYIYGKNIMGVFRIDIDNSFKTVFISTFRNKAVSDAIHINYDVPGNTYTHNSAIIITKSEFIKVYREFKQTLKDLNL